MRNSDYKNDVLFLLFMIYLLMVCQTCNQCTHNDRVESEISSLKYSIR